MYIVLNILNAPRIANGERLFIVIAGIDPHGEITASHITTFNGTDTNR